MLLILDGENNIVYEKLLAMMTMPPEERDGCDVRLLDFDDAAWHLV